jgi:hypothetical protein
VDLDLELVSSADKAALLALSTLEWLATTKSVLNEMGYKVHSAGNHEDFLLRFGRVQYQIVIVEELFASSTMAENLALKQLQHMPMNQRRNAVSILIGSSCQTLNPMQAFQQSVHAVICPSDLPQLQPIVQQAAANHDLFLKVYRDCELRLAQGQV